jgi:uroporphyrinogen-III synthase
MQTMPPLLIVTRPHETGQAFARKVVAEYGDVEVILSPGLRILPLAAEVPADVAHVIFTSANGVAQAIRLGLTPHAHAWCVGRRTADAAKALGFKVTVGGGDALQLIETIKEAAPLGRIVHVAGQHRQGDVAATLRRHGLDCSEVIAYHQLVCAPTPALEKALLGDRPLVIPLFSARSGLTIIGTDHKAPLHIIAISPSVAQMVTDWGVDTVACADSPDEAAMIAQTCIVLDRLNLGSSVS